MEGVDHQKAAQRQRRSSFTPIRALRSLSITSQLSNSSETDATFPSTRRRNTLQKGRPSVSILYEELSRRPSKSSTGGRTDGTSISTRPASPTGSGSQSTSISGDLPAVVHHGPLQQESSMLKTKKEYLVLTGTSLLKFKNRNAATDQYPQISAKSGAVESPLSPVDSLHSFKDSVSAADVHVPLEKVVSVFKDESNRPSFGIEIWWRNTAAPSAFSCLELDFNLPEERDEWLMQLQHSIKLRCKASSEEEVPVEVEVCLRQIIEAKHKHMSNSHIDIFPVVPRQPYSRMGSNTSEVRKGWRDGASFFLAFSKNSCLLAKFTKSPTGHKVNPDLVQFGIVTLSRMNASYRDERFDLIFRLPLDVPQKIQLASRHHRTILTTLIKADSFLKPSWPHWTRREVFFVDGEPHHIHLAEGEDFGGFKRSLEAFLEGYHCGSVNWTTQWKNVRYAPEFQLLPPSGQTKYTAHQLLAVFRALRYNDYFKSLSFSGIDFSSLSGAVDNRSRLEPTTWLSRTGKRSLTRVEFELVENASVLFQEVVALMIGSESLRHLDLSHVLSRPFEATATRMTDSYPSPPMSRECEIVAPIVLLWKSLQTRCNSVNISGNPLGVNDVAGLSRILQSRPDFLRSLTCSQCQLDHNGLSLLWDGLYEQRNSIESIDLSHNLGSLEASIVYETLHEAKRLRRLNLAYVLKGDVTGALFPPWKTASSSDPWRLEDVDLSGWKMNFDTAVALSNMIQSEDAPLRHLSVKNCGLTGEMATPLLCVKARDIELIISENPLEIGSLDWIDLIYGSEAPKRLHLDMIQFQDEANFHRLLTALAHNKSIEFLSLVGTGPPAKTSSKTSKLLSVFFESNTTLRFLDLSGYSGKLEDVHLGWGLSGALSSLRDNTTLRQLRVRNHDMGSAEDVSSICDLITANRGLTMFDCQQNNLDRHQFAKLVGALEQNRSIVSFPFSSADRSFAFEEERRAFMHNGTGKCTKISLSNIGKTEQSRLDGALKSLVAQWELEATKLANILQRNREETLGNPLVDLEGQDLEAWKDEGLSAWLRSIRKVREPFHAPRSSRDRLSMVSSVN